MNLTPKPIQTQQRQVSAVVDVGMCQQHRIDVPRFNPQRGAVAQPQLLVALEQTAVDQNALAVMLNEKFGAGDGVGGS